MSIRKLGKSSTMFLGHATWAFNNSWPRLEVFIFHSGIHRKRSKSCKPYAYMLCKEQSYKSAWPVLYITLIFFLSFFDSTHPMCVCISVLLRDTVFLVGLVLLLSARQLCSTFTGLLVPPALHCSLGPLRRIGVHDILSMRSNEICYSFEQICDS